MNDVKADGLVAIGTCACGETGACGVSPSLAVMKVSEMLMTMLLSGETKQETFALWFIAHFEAHGGVEREITTYQDAEFTEG